MCLHAVLGQGLDDLEVIVVDSAPSCMDARAIAEEFGARYLHVPQPGLSRARNAGAHEASGEVLVFLDDDVTVQAGCIAALLAEFSDPRTAAVGGRILLADGDPEVRSAFEAFGAFDPGPERRVVDRHTPGWFELTNFGGLGTGAMLAIRRSAFASWPGFDERLGRGAPMDAGEELFAYFSLAERGHRVIYTPVAIASHPAPASFDELRRRVLDGAASGAAYMTLLLVECRGHRIETLRYAWQALRGRRREWRSKPATARHVLVPRWRERLAWLMGPVQYVRMRVMTLLGPRAWYRKRYQWS
jgi:O-antigen biosynthesis protein